jgi:hypothetical protein
MQVVHGALILGIWGISGIWDDELLRAGAGEQKEVRWEDFRNRQNGDPVWLTPGRDL